MSSPRNIVVVSDTHCGSALGLVPENGVQLDDGGRYEPSALQRKMWALWREFWGEWVPRATKGEPFILVVNGDAIDGNHHGTTAQASINLTDQSNIGYQCFRPIVDRAAMTYWTRGTEVHVGQSGAQEEMLAHRLGAVTNEVGNHARWELWLNLHGHLCHFTHHVGTTGSSSYEATAIGKEMVENYVESGRWGAPSAQIVCRSHRHRYYETRHYGSKGLQISMVTPGFQLRTPFSYRIAARMSEPQIGGVLIRVGDEEVFTRAMVWPLGRSATEVVA